MRRNWTKILKHIDPSRRDKVKQLILAHYDDIVTTNYPVQEDPPGENGLRALRFKEDPVVRWLVNRARARNDPFLNELALRSQEGDQAPFRRSLKAFYRRMGYSLCGFAEVFCS